MDALQFSIVTIRVCARCRLAVNWGRILIFVHNEEGYFSPTPDCEPRVSMFGVGVCVGIFNLANYFMQETAVLRLDWPPPTPELVCFGRKRP